MQICKYFICKKNWKKYFHAHVKYRTCVLLVQVIFIVSKYVYSCKISHILENFDLCEGQTFTWIFGVTVMSLIFLHHKPSSSKHLFKEESKKVVPKKCFIFVFCWNSFSSFGYIYTICLQHITSVLECFWRYHQKEKFYYDY